MENIYVVAIDFGKGYGYIHFYQQTTLEKLKNYIKKRGMDKIQFKHNFSDEKIIELNLQEFKKMYY